MSTLAQGAIKSLPIVVPPLPEQRDILNYVDSESQPVSSAIGRLEREIELLREYRDRLVAGVVTGQLDVREAAARLPDDVSAGNEAEPGDPELIDEEATEA